MGSGVIQVSHNNSNFFINCEIADQYTTCPAVEDFNLKPEDFLPVWDENPNRLSLSP
jgi:hypothetical protein